MTDQVWEDAIARGIENQNLIHLAERHCTHIKFVEFGGRGMAEEATGLPINMRQVRCPVAHGNASAVMSVTLPEFYREHCVGCTMRTPTGQVPNLSTHVDDLDAAAALAESRQAERIDDLHSQWVARSHVRQALSAQVDDVSATVVADIAILDLEPGAERDNDAEGEAVARLRALAQRAPSVVSTAAVNHAVELAAAGHASAVILDPLRLMARTRPEFAQPVIVAALTVLHRGPSVPAGRCIADLIDHVSAADVDDKVCSSLIILAGSPQGDGFTRTRSVSDPVGLVAIADLAPQRLLDVLRTMLPGPTPPTGLVLPPGTATRDSATLFTVGAAAGAARVLAGTHPELAGEMVAPLILQMASDLFDRFDDGIGSLQRALAVMLVSNVGDVPAAMIAAGARGSEDFGPRLVRVLSLAEDLVSHDPRRRESGDPTPTPDRADEVYDLLFEMSLARMGGDWGSRAVAEASDLIEDLARSHPEETLQRLPAVLGAVLTLIDSLNDAPVSTLEVVGGDSPMIRAMEAETNKVMRRSAISRLQKAINSAASPDPLAVLEAVVDVITDERDSDRGDDVAYYLLETVGEIGAAHGNTPGLLQAILPVLHTYLVGAEIGPRGRALDAWVSIGRRHQLPSSLVDLLPALSSDRYVFVAQALMRATTALEWPAAAWPRLMLHAATMLDQFKDGSNTGALKEAIGASLQAAIKMDQIDILQAVEQRALEAAGRLSAYDIKRLLSRKWTAPTAKSDRMALMRLVQAADPRINDRFNHRDEDPEMVALLDCGPGLLSLDTDDLVGVASDLGPDRPIAAAEFLEVAWRAGRPADTVAIIDALLAATPDEPAYAVKGLFFNVLASAARADAAAAVGAPWQAHAAKAVAGAEELRDVQDADRIKHVSDSVVAIFGLRRQLVARPLTGNPAEQLHAHAEELVAAADLLASPPQHMTPTGVYLRAVAASADVLAHLMRAEAAAYDADTEKINGHHVAAQRRCDLVIADVTENLGADDPLAGPLLVALEAVRTHTAGDPSASLLGTWGSLVLPVPVARGPSRGDGRPVDRSTPETGSSDRAGRPVGVVLAALDGQLITGPAVLRHGRVYELSVQVQAGEWPAWATRLDAELLSHLTSAEMTTPTFSWSRSDHVDDEETYEQSGSVVLRFSVASGSVAPPLLFRLAWRGEENGKARTQTLDVAGHRELRLRPYDEARDRATDFPVFDERLLEMYDRLARAGYDEKHLQAFCRLFTSICRAGLAITWEKRYRRGTRVTERAFHDDIHERLMADPELGGRVERGSPLALGFLDVRHDGITAELKVERQAPVTRERAPKYMGQPTQYAAADGARLSILTILDMSPKEMPIGTPENYLFDLVPQHHGLENPEAPSLVAVLIVNGNLPTPSSWSRRRPPVQHPSD